MWRRPNQAVEKAFRSVAFVRSETPFVIIADDIKKDNQVHNYESYMQLPFDLDQRRILPSLSTLRLSQLTLNATPVHFQTCID